MKRIELDRGLCQGHGRCTLMSPDVFDLDEDGFGILLSNDVGKEQEDGVRRAVDNCPERAITAS